jgi:hypothetical protein
MCAVTDPPDDGNESMYSSLTRKWSRADDRDSAAPRSVAELSKRVDGMPELQFL